MAEVKSFIICRLHSAQTEGEAQGTAAQRAHNSWALHDGSQLFPDLSGRLTLSVTGLCRARVFDMREAAYLAVLRKSLQKV